MDIGWRASWPTISTEQFQYSNSTTWYEYSSNGSRLLQRARPAGTAAIQE
jgi:hypothetical protein